MTSDSSIRPARAQDREAIERIVAQAYDIYIPRLGQKPGPMLDDYAARIAAGEAFVVEEAGSVRAVLVLIDEPDALLLDNLAVDPGAQRGGYGGRLADFAEAEALRRGYAEIKLYTHQTMTENVTYYAKRGYEETGRGEQAGYARIFMHKRLQA